MILFDSRERFPHAGLAPLSFPPPTRFAKLVGLTSATTLNRLRIDTRDPDVATAKTGEGRKCYQFLHGGLCTAYLIKCYTCATFAFRLGHQWRRIHNSQPRLLCFGAAPGLERGLAGKVALTRGEW